MIVKKMKRTNFSKSKAVMISELVDYIFASHDDHGKEKLAHFGAMNFLTTTRAAQKTMVSNIQSLRSFAQLTN